MIKIIHVENELEKIKKFNINNGIVKGYRLNVFGVLVHIVSDKFVH
jgi:hypothetical protein